VRLVKKQFGHGKSLGKLVLLPLALGWLGAQAADDFRVYETGTELQVVTPYGNKTITGDFPIETSSNYRIEVPLADLMPAKKDPRPWEQRGPASKDEWGFSPPPVRAGDYDDSDKLVLEANHLYNQGRYFDASLVVESLLRRNPKYTRAWIMKGSLMYVQGQKDLAKKAWDQAISLSPDDVEVREALERYK